MYRWWYGLKCECGRETKENKEMHRENRLLEGETLRVALELLKMRTNLVNKEFTFLLNKEE